MNLKDYIKQLENFTKLLANDKEIANKITLVAAKEFEGTYKKRIFVMGKDSKGRQIGNYSIKPFYIAKTSKTLIGVKKSGFSPQGKNGKAKFKNGKTKKSRYLKNGYKELRERAGRQSKTVDLNLSGSLFNSMQTGIRGNLVVFGFSDAKNIQKANGQEKRFRRVIFAPSKNELEVFANAVNREFKKLINDILKK